MKPKYRAWLKFEQCFADSIESIRYDKEAIFLKWGGFGRSERFEFYEVELMQSTGLVDKNGKEVFVGDIIKCTRGCPHEVYLEKEYGGTFIGGMPAVYLKGLLSGYAWTEAEEIIGNIYENPELLEEKE